MSARIYDRPDIDQRRQNLALLVVGSFDTARPSEPYESRLQIKNGVGACRVRQIDGDTLPPGHQLYVDQATAEVVLTWPAFQSQAAPITNPGFEGGPAAWEGGAGWAVTTLGPIVGAWSGEYASNRGESVLSNTARYAVYPGQRTLAKCKVRQGASAEGNAGASVLLEYRNADGGVVSAQEGNRVMSASKGAVYDSTVEGQAPVGATTVNIASNGIRYRENKPLFVDEFEWNHTVAVVGINYEAEYTVSLQVSDSAGRAAIWRGKVRVLFGEVDPFWDNVVSVMNFEGIGDDFHDGKGHTWNAQGGVVQVGGGITLAVDGQSVWSDGPFPGQSAMTDFTIEAFITVAGYNPAWGFVINFAAGSTGLYIGDSGQLGFYNGGVWVSQHVVPVGQKVHVCIERKDNIVTAYLNGIGAGSNERTFPTVGVSQLGIGADQKINSFFRGTIYATRVTSYVARYGGNFDVPNDPFPERG